MARILASYIESQKVVGEYKSIDIAKEVINIMNIYNAQQTQEPLNLKRWISCVLDGNAKKPGVKKTKKF